MGPKGAALLSPAAAKAAADADAQSARRKPLEETKESPIHPGGSRIRKRSMLARRPSKQAAPSEPVPPMHFAETTDNRSDTKSVPSVSSTRNQHRKSPSVSVLPSTNLYRSNVAQHTADEFGNLGTDPASSVTRNSRANQDVPWPGHSTQSQKGLFTRSIPFRSNILPGSDGSTSTKATDRPEPQNALSAHKDSDTSRGWTSLEAPSRDSRQMPPALQSRHRQNSLFGLKEDAKVLKAEQIDSDSDLKSKASPWKEKRRLFGRASRSGTVDGSSRPSEFFTHLERGDSILRKVSSRSLQKLGRDRSVDAMASTDSLASTSTNSTSRSSLARRAGDLLSKTPSLSQWGRKSFSNADRYRDLSQDFSSTSQGPITSQDSCRLPTDQTPYDTLSPRKSADSSMPRRFSGWLGNILGSENHDAAAPAAKKEDQENYATSSGSKPSLIDDHVAPTPSPAACSITPQVSSSSHPSSRSLHDPSATHTASRAAQSASGTRNRVGLLSSLTASGRARTDAGAGASGSGAARGGFDRALRYFMDNNEPEDNLNEGMWLLGVLHNTHEGHVKPSTTSESAPTAPDTLGEEEPVPPEDFKAGPINKEEHLERDDEIGGVRKSRATSPSSGSSSLQGDHEVKESNHSGVKTESNILARNPPTPHASPSKKHKEEGPSEVLVSEPQERAMDFQTDFSSRIWCTYRSHFSPIARDGSITQTVEDDLSISPTRGGASDSPKTSHSTSVSSRGWLNKRTADPDEQGAVPASRSFAPGSPPQHALGPAFGLSTSSNPAPSSSATGLGERMGIPTLLSRAQAAAQAYGLTGRYGLTTDAGWGCMLRTGQSVLANALLTTHLGRDWRRESRSILLENPVQSEGGSANMALLQSQRRQYAQYVRILNWFMDDPSVLCPFSVHRMAREGKRLGKEVGEWFGPSTAAGAIKSLIQDFPEAGLGVSVASDGVIYLDQVQAQAQSLSSPRKKRSSQSWEKPVLILIGIRLGLEGVHPMYHESVKATFSFPQSVGIAGGRPSSSYYFVGYQGNSLFYLDPHHVRSSIPFRPPPPEVSNDDEWWLHAYSEQDLATFHCDRPRRMPMKSLDPSMLLGFLIRDEDSLQDFTQRVKQLPKPIFSVLNSMPRWMMDNENNDEWDEEKAIESISEDSRQDHGSSEASHDQEERLSSEPDTVPSKARLHDTALISKAQQITVSEHSCHSIHTATPQSESTFEFIEQKVSPPIHKLTTSMHVFPSVEDETSQASDQSQAPPSPVVSGDGRKPSIHDDSLSGPYSVVDASDEGSVWEDVRADVSGSPIKSAPIPSRNSVEKEVHSHSHGGSPERLQEPIHTPETKHENDFSP